MSESATCWCGNSTLAPFSGDYLCCADCETLVLRRMPTAEQLMVADDERDFYGQDYFDYQARTRGHPALEERSLIELRERCLYWLRTLLPYKLPPARILEIGCAHGAFVALLRAAGFDAMGLELSAATADGARRRFDVPVVAGPIEAQNIPPESLDVIVLMDVLEQLHDPLDMMRKCLKLLKPDGLLCLQTPRYREGKTLELMQADQDPFPAMLVLDQHTYLFSGKSVRLLLERSGAEHISFEPAIFGAYDMSLVAGRQPLSRFAEEEIEANLKLRPSGRLVLAMLDLDRHCQVALTRSREVEASLARQLQNGAILERAYAESEADRAARLQNILKLEELVRAAQAQASVTLASLERIRAENGELARLNEQDRIENEQKRREIERVRAESGELARQSEQKRRELESRLADEERRSSIGESLLGRIRGSYVYRLMRACGLWGWLDDSQRAGAPDRRPVALRRVAVDLTPVQPGGENGGAKVMTLELLRHLALMAPECQFILLTSESSHDELAALAAANVKRLCVHRPGGALSAADNFAVRLRRVLGRVLSVRRLNQLAGLYREATGQVVVGSDLVRRLDADLLFCPFTAPYYFHPSVPTVSVVYDLQHREYRQFFSELQVYERERSFDQACRLASRLVCISDYVRKAVLESGLVPAERLETVPIQLGERLPRVAPESRAPVLRSLGLEPERYLLYPANFWPHKNHEMLLTAFGLYRSSHPDSDLKLVLTGAPGTRQDFLVDAAARMGMSGSVVFPGYVPEADFSALMQGSMALIFPSLFEGFGMPLLEAMAAARPLLVSNATSLPEVAGDAALLFDARRPMEIVDAIARIASDPQLRAELAAASAHRLQAFGGAREMAASYLRIFHDACSQSADLEPAVHGIFDDGWLGERMTVVYGRGHDWRRLRVRLAVPDWAPVPKLDVRVSSRGDDGDRLRMGVAAGTSATVNVALSGETEWAEMRCSPTFQPDICGAGPDSRALSCRVLSVEIVGADGMVLDLGGKTHVP
ncbi:MAG: glycosyltransferase [Bryobacteraceae bacterium]|jgi:glycosyltransferase involved in cell wall biosynthesis/SAM-dependent methyltransferase